MIHLEVIARALYVQTSASQNDVRCFLTYRTQVKADRGELNTDQKTIKELQDESAKAAQKEKEQKGN